MDGPSAAIIVAAVWGKSSDESEGALIASGRLSRLKIPENIIYQRFIGQRRARAYLLLFAAYNSNDVRGGSIDHLLWCGAEFDVCVLLLNHVQLRTPTLVISVNQLFVPQANSTKVFFLRSALPPATAPSLCMR